MKIENTGISPITPKLTDAATRVDKTPTDRQDVKAVRSSSQDKAEMSDQARLLSKARTALGNVEDPNSDKLATLRAQIENGDYKVQVTDLARKLAAKFYPK